MDEERIYQHNYTTLINSHRWARHEEDFIKNIEEAKRKMKEDDIPWSTAFRSLRNRFPKSVDCEDMIYKFCNISESSYGRRRTALPRVKSTNTDILNLVLACGLYTDKDKVAKLFQRYVHAPDPFRGTNLNDIIFGYIAKHFDYQNDILPLVINRCISPFFGYKRLAELFLNQYECSPFDYIKRATIQKGTKLNQDILTIPVQSNNGQKKCVRISLVRGSHNHKGQPKDALSVYRSFLLYVDKQAQKLNDFVIHKLTRLIAEQCETLKESTGTTITISSMKLPKSTLKDRFSRYTSHPVTMPPLTRDNIITLGTHLAMTYVQIDQMLEIAYMDQLVYKNPSDCMLLYVLGELERKGKLNIDIDLNDVDKAISRKILIDLFEDDYEEIKNEVLNYYQGFTHKTKAQRKEYS